MQYLKISHFVLFSQICKIFMCVSRQKLSFILSTTSCTLSSLLDRYWLRTFTFSSKISAPISFIYIYLYIYIYIEREREREREREKERDRVYISLYSIVYILYILYLYSEKNNKTYSKLFASLLLVLRNPQTATLRRQEML